jgi:hypothetical protein
MRSITLGVSLVCSALLAILLPVSASAGSAVVVFSTDFESGLPPEFSAPGSVLQGVQGYAGLGPAGRQFGGNFLRYTSVPIFPTTLTLRNLPSHDHVSVKFLLGLIDSWDGTELMKISVDGALAFDHWFQLALGDTTSYHPAPPGAILSMGTNLGFSGCCYYNRDRAYDLGVEPAFLDIPHTADSLIVLWTIGAISGPAADQWQGGDDESWAIDAVSVEVSTQDVDVEGGLAARRLAVSAMPNPARGGLVKLQLRLPAAGRARVELLDLAGRRVTSRDFEAAAAGQQALDLSTGRRVVPGLYFARVTQGGEARTARVIVTD